MIFDLHNDFLTSSEIKKSLVKSLTENIKKDLLGEQYYDMVTYAVWTTRLKNPVRYIREIAKIPVKYTAIEDLHFIRPENLYILKQLKPLYVSLTWNGENLLAGGADSDVGLSAFGKDMIRYLNQAGILLDTAHLSRPAFFEVASATDAPLICSHTCFSGVFAHKRNLSDLQIKTIMDSGGIIGLCLVPEFMGKTMAATQDVVRQIDYFVQKFGANHLCIGTDFYGTDNPAVSGYCGFNKVAESLSRLGYRQKDINKILFKNALDFLSRIKRSKTL